MIYFFKLYKLDHSGAAEARNYGIKNSKGHYLIFLDSDDSLKDDALEKLLTW